MSVDDGAQPVTHEVVLELAGWVAEDDLSTDLEQSPQHRLHDYTPTVTLGRDGRTTLTLTIAGSDLWTCTLTAMAVIRQAGYEPTSVHVVPLAWRRAA
jgi:hypothetical protein